MPVDPDKFKQLQGGYNNNTGSGWLSAIKRRLQGESAPSEAAPKPSPSAPPKPKGDDDSQ